MANSVICDSFQRFFSVYYNQRYAFNLFWVSRLSKKLSAYEKKCYKFLGFQFSFAMWLGMISVKVFAHAIPHELWIVSFHLVLSACSVWLVGECFHVLSNSSPLRVLRISSKPLFEFNQLSRRNIFSIVTRQFVLPNYLSFLEILLHAFFTHDNQWNSIFINKSSD